MPRDHQSLRTAGVLVSFALAIVLVVITRSPLAALLCLVTGTWAAWLIIGAGSRWSDDNDVIVLSVKRQLVDTPPRAAAGAIAAGRPPGSRFIILRRVRLSAVHSARWDATEWMVDGDSTLWMRRVGIAVTRWGAIRDLRHTKPQEAPYV